MSRENYRILVVDDESSIILLLKRILEDEGYRVKTASNGEEALRTAASFAPHLIITDLKMPAMDGMTLMKTYRDIDPETDFIVLTAFGAVDTAVASMKMGALDYLIKPLREPEELRIAVGKAFERRRLMDENAALKMELHRDMPPIDIIFAGMEPLLDDVRAVAPTTSTVLLLGETGTGKSLIAKVIHGMSGRKGPFVEVNCPAVPETLLESEFYGHEKGAFTGAIAAKKGKFELAAGGSIFLDEVAEISPAMQAKLLRVLQDGYFERVGGTHTFRTDARVIVATNRDLGKEVAAGRFREDLFFRLNVFPLNIRPLRERAGALPRIAEYLVRVLSLRTGRQPVGIAARGMEKILGYSWPGNVRELQNVLERAIILSRGDVLDDAKLTLDAVSPGDVPPGTLKDMEREAIAAVLGRTGGNRKNAAEMLGISLRALQYKIKEYGL